MNKENSFNSLISSVKVGIWTFLSRIFGLLRDIATTNLLGASIFHDVFIVVLKIPNVFRRFFAEGAFSQAFVPIYSSLILKDNNLEAGNFVNSLFGILLLALAIFTIIAYFFAPSFIFIFAPGFYFDDATRELAVNLLRIMFPYLGLISLVSFAAGIQNSHNFFSIPAATPLIFNLSLIIACLFFAQHFNLEVYALAWGVLIAGIIQLLLQFFPLKYLGTFPKIQFDTKNKNVKNFFIIILPAIIAGGVAQINLLVDTIFASLLATGSPTWLYVSDRLIQLPLGIFAIAIGTVLLPDLSRSFSISDKTVFKSKLSSGVKLVFFLSVPSAFGLYVLGGDIIEVLFMRGEFNNFDVQMSFYSLQMFTFGLPFFMLMKVLVPAFFAQQDTKTPLYISIASLILNIFLNYILAFSLGFGHYGLALASSLASFLSVVLMINVLSQQKHILLKDALDTFFIKVIIASVVMTAIIIFASNFIQLNDLLGLNKFLSTVFIIFLGLISYISFIILFGLRKKDIL